MPYAKSLLLYNPVAGTRKAESYLPSVIQALSRQGQLALCYASQKKGDAFRLARDLAGEVENVIAIGGDGTISEAAAGLLASTAKTPFSLLPAGTTNDFAGGLGLADLSEEERIQVAIQGTVHPFDMGLLNDRPFIYVAAFGAFSSVSYRTPQASKNALGKFAYLLEGIKDLTELTSYHLQITSDQDQLEGDFLLGLVSNSNIVAGLVNMEKDTDYKDGRFEILLVRAGYSPMDYAAVAREMRSGLFSHPAIEFLQVQEARITSDSNLQWTLDGEEGGSAKNNYFRVLDRAIQVRVPGQGWKQ